MPAAGQPQWGPTTPRSESQGGRAQGRRGELPLAGPGTAWRSTWLPNQPTHLGVHHPGPKGVPCTPLSPQCEMPAPGAQAGHGGPETNPPVGQSPRTLRPRRSHLRAAWHHRKGPWRAPVPGSPGELHETAPGHHSAPGLRAASLPPTPRLAPTCPPRAPPCRAGHTGGGPHLTAGSGRAGSGVSAGASVAQSGGRGTKRGGSRRRGDSWADRATLKIAKECEGPAGARSSRRERRGGHAASGASPPPPPPPPPPPEEVMWARSNPALRGELPGLRPTARPGASGEGRPQAERSRGAGGSQGGSCAARDGFARSCSPVSRGGVPGVGAGCLTS